MMDAESPLPTETSSTAPDLHQRRLHWAWVMDGCALGATLVALVAQAFGLGILVLVLAALGAFSGIRVLVAQGQTPWRRLSSAAAVAVGLFGMWLGWSLTANPVTK